MSESNDLIMGGGGGCPALKLDKVGDKVRYQIVRVGKPVQAKEPSGPRKGQLKVWPSGDPVMQVPIELKTDQRDPLDSEDEGHRTWWVRQSSDPQQKLRDAIAAAGAKEAEIGATGEIELIGLDAANFSIPKKLHAVTYVSPGSAAANNVLLGSPSSGNAAPSGDAAAKRAELEAQLAALQNDAPPF